MATWKYELAEPPAEPRALELWLQHAAGFILFEDVRRFALDRIDPGLPLPTQAAVKEGIDNALAGLMQVIDGVTGGLSNPTHTVHIDFVVRPTTADSREDSAVSEVDLRDGDGMCMGYHGWLDGDFGERPIATSRSTR